MKSLVRLVVVLGLLVGSFGWFGLSDSAMAASMDWTQVTGQSSPVLIAEAEYRNSADDKLATDFGKKLDLNNSDVRDFRQFPGMYPTLAGLIISNAPYETVEDVLNIPGLSDAQKELLQANLESFTVTEISDTYTEGEDRYNAGVY
ncbi:MAG TPA: photosystem II protein [Cyanobacteria bacterium UBA11149]|nr:photosystem II protein [Cyanobacteria bacterium UBA11367]HBE58726.1 photosystem II protein [Cyanobacteria bacterium UBA11366]HBK65869.1 photosystem II protein [Cyanobacteria bacterium UBA11166]HBR76486.1 photosystem II protein [Cyanobacteria bacterium UBA11159]HBS69271.1 photosystem II protein [Cyanobacteria bacterium UBA11153]HBW87596.1 photosystem II protein [Cyanobacteria bacterium UBA11149]HCA97382.1 photosystem II protein [Cyanobacteria bacterium UBA9226]